MLWSVGFLPKRTADSWDFTGQHRSVTHDNSSYNSKYLGYIVSSIGQYKYFNNKYPKNQQNIKINSALTYVKLTKNEKWKCVHGVISDNEENTRTYEQGSFNTGVKQNEGDKRIIINALGKGGLWIKNYNNNLRNLLYNFWFMYETS